MYFKNKMLIIIMLLSLTGCTSPLTKQDIEKIETIGVLNKFPDKPNFVNVGTTIFNNKSDTVNDASFKNYLTIVISKHLKERGYSVVELSKGMSISGIDLVLEVKPRGVYNMIDTDGYGFHDRSVLGKSISRTAYVALNLVPKTGGRSRCESCYGQSLDVLPTLDMPDLWDELSDRDKEIFKRILNENIVNAIKIALPKTGL